VPVFVDLIIHQAPPSDRLAATRPGGVDREPSAGANSMTKRPALSMTSVPKTAHALRSRLPIHAASSGSARRV
jgi:hypothetical protein